MRKVAGGVMVWCGVMVKLRGVDGGGTTLMVLEWKLE